MDKLNRFAIMMEALTELAQEENLHLPSGTLQPPPEPDQPNLVSVLADTSPLPQGALFLGMADDGLPVLLNLHDPVPGPILIVGDQASGKTNFLQVIARAADVMHTPEHVQYGIITTKPDEWKVLPESQNKAGIFPASDESAKELLQSLVTWSHKNKGGEQSILLFIDDLSIIEALDEQAQQNLRWLLLRGPSRRVWPFITLNSSLAHDLTKWLGFFHTRLFGFIQYADDAQLLIGNRDYTFDTLNSGSQFAMRENDQLLRFWLPTI